MSQERAGLIRKVTAEHAWRMIFAQNKDDEIPKLRPRIMSREEVQREREQWDAWHDQQMAAEREMVAETERPV